MSTLDFSQVLQTAYDDSTQSLKIRSATNWIVSHSPAAATQATITKPAIVGSRHVCVGMIITIAAGATAQTPISVTLRDGASGVGTILASFTLAAPANGVGGIALDQLAILGSSNTPMTLEFSNAGVAASLEAVNLIGYDVAG